MTFSLHRTSRLGCEVTRLRLRGTLVAEQRPNTGGSTSPKAVSGQPNSMGALPPE